MKLSAKGVRIALRVFCALALIAISFAHRPVQNALPASAMMAAYILPDGSAPTLCLNAENGDRYDRDHPTPGTGCEACRLAGSTLLPAPSCTAEPSSGSLVSAPAPFKNIARALRILCPNSLPRAPPSASIA